MASVPGPSEDLTQPARIVAGYPQTFARTPALALVRRPLTLSELTGPLEPQRRLRPLAGDLAGSGERRAIGQAIRLRVRILDDGGAPVAGALVEMWQANAAGRYIHPNDDDHAPVDPNFYGAARLVADENGLIEIRTVKPGAYPVPTRDGWWRPPHVHFSVFGRVWLSRLVTQMYFPGEPLNAQDRILNAVPDAQARERLIARLVPPTGDPYNELVYEHRIVVRGREATPPAAVIRTPEQTLGPFFLPRFVDAGANDLTMLDGRRARGEPIEIHGVVTEEGGAALENLIVEIWQADASGIYRHPLDPRHREADPGFLGWGRAATDRDGRYAFRTIRPGACAGRAPHINMMLMYSGLMRILKTALFFADAAENEADPVLLAVPPARRALLVARREEPGRYRFDIRLRGNSETPFFAD